MVSNNIIIELFRAKGWNLYKGSSGEDFPSIFSHGKATSLEKGAYYHVVPIAFRDNNIEEVIDHLTYARETKQFPIYDDKTNPSARIKGIIGTDSGCMIVPDADIHIGGILHGYEFNAQQIENVIKFNISNYNIHYFNSINEVADFVAHNKLTAQTPTPLTGQLRWEYALRDKSSWEKIIYPSDASPVLFRGQNRRYEPCNPTIAREIKNWSRNLYELSQPEQVALVLNLIKTHWFIESLEETPAFQWFKQNYFYMDKTAVAQHYGLPTGYIDLSQSFDVSSFFACCRYNKMENRWEPIGEGKGVIYVVDTRQFPFGMGPKAICLQPFPRPSEQWGWVHEVTLGDDFDSLPYVRKFIFKHDKDESQIILEKFKYGNALFPPDPLARLADRINAANEIPLDIARKVAEDLVADPQGFPGISQENLLAMIAETRKITFTDTPIIVFESELRSEMQACWDLRKGNFFEGIGVRFVRTIRKDDLPS